MASPESISLYLEDLDLKKNSLRKAILMLAVEWKYMDEHLDLTKECFSDCVTGLESERKRLESIRDSVIEHNRELEILRESLEARRRELDSREDNFLSFQQTQLMDFEKKEKQLAELRTWVVERMEEVELKNERLSKQKESIELLLTKFQIEKNEFEDIKKTVGEKLNELSLNEKNIDNRSKELHLVQDWIERRAKILDSKEEEVEMREQQLKPMQQCLNDVHDKSKQLKNEQKLHEEHCKEFELKEKQLEERSKDFDLIFKQFVERSNDLVLKETQFEERCKEFEWKEKLLEEQSKNFESMAKQYEELSKDLVLKERQLEECRKEFESRKKQLEEHTLNFDSVENQFEGRWKDLLLKVIQLEERTKGFESKQLQKKKGQKRTKPDSDDVDLTRLSEESKLVSSVIAPCHPGRSMSALGSASQVLSPLLANMDGENLLFFLSKHVEVHELMHREVYVALQMAPDPGKLVLNATQGFLSPVLMEVDSDIDVHALRSCIFLLDILPSVKPVISSQVKEESRQLAVDWKVNAGMREGNSLLTFGFSRFVGAYGLTSTFGTDELLNIDKHTQIPKLNYALGCSEDMPVWHVLEYEKKTSQSAKDPEWGRVPDAIWRASDPAKLVLDAIESCYYSELGSGNMSKFEILKSLNFLLSQMLKVKVEVTSQIKEQAMKITADWKEKVKSQSYSEIQCFLLFLATFKVTSSCDTVELLGLFETVFSRKTTKYAVDLLRSLGLEDEVPNFINLLVQWGMHLDAIKYVFAFELGDKFPPATLLEGYIIYVEAVVKSIRAEGCYSVKAKDNAAYKELHALERVVNCCRQHKLGSQYPLKNIEARITQLKKQLEKKEESGSKVIHKKKRKGFVTKHANNEQFHPLRVEKLPQATVPQLPYQPPCSVCPLRSPPCLIPLEGYYCSVESTYDPPYMTRSSLGFGNINNFGYPPKFNARPGAIPGMRYSSVRDQLQWR